MQRLVPALVVVCLAAAVAAGADPPALRTAEQGVELGSAAVPDDAAAPTPETLEEFVALAERSHPRLRQAAAAVEAARGKAVQARLYPNPMLAAGSPQAAGRYSQWNVYASQDVVTGGKLRLQQQAALREVQQAEYELIRARYEVLTGVRTAFYDLAVAQRRAEIFTLLLDIAKRSYEIGRQLAAAGEGTKADVLFWSIERDRAEASLLNAAVLIEADRRQLATAVGLPRADVGRIRADLYRRMPDFDLKALQEAVVRANAQPRAAESAVARTQWALERAAVQPIPNINLMGGYQRQVDYPAQDQALVQVMAAVPLFDRNQGNIRSARADIAQARAALRGVELDLAARTATALAQYRTAQQLAAWYETRILPQARETVALTQTLYARGEVTFLSLLQAQKILTETELTFVEAQAERWRGAATIADLLQLDEFPPDDDAPAALALGADWLPRLPDTAAAEAKPAAKPEAVPAPAPKR
ncbi:MAG: TolC family protein [Planctomycetes bacterium]|nr:TolC family protein [Planctomycetota bacterium]